MDDVGCFSGGHKRIAAEKQIGIGSNRACANLRLPFFAAASIFFAVVLA